MASEIADSGAERSRIMSWRVMFMAVGLSISAFAGAFVQRLGGGVHGYATMSWVYGGICLCSMLATVVVTGNATMMQAEHAARAEATQLSLIGQFRLVAENRSYVRLWLVGFAQKLGEGVGYGSFAYFCIYVVRQDLSAIGLVVLASMAGQVLSQPLWLKAGRRWSPTTLYTVGVLGWCLSLLLWLAMRGRSPLWLLPLGLEAGAAAGGFLMVTLTMLSNTLAADAARTGVNHEGAYSGFWCAGEKLGFAAGALVVGVLIGAFGFVQSANGTQAAQTPRAVLGIAVTYCGVNMLIYLGSILAIRRFARLSR